MIELINELSANRAAVFDKGGQQLSNWFRWPLRGVVSIDITAAPCAASHVGFWDPATESVRFVGLAWPEFFSCAGQMVFGDVGALPKAETNYHEDPDCLPDCTDRYCAHCGSQLD